jgi:hypothetical protein
MQSEWPTKDTKSTKTSDYGMKQIGRFEPPEGDILRVPISIRCLWFRVLRLFRGKSF